MKKGVDSGVGSGSICQRYGSGDPDPHLNVTDPQHWSSMRKILELACLTTCERRALRERQCFLQTGQLCPPPATCLLSTCSNTARYAAVRMLRLKLSKSN